jgi:hypothetical protein
LECQGDLANARMMYLKSLAGYKKVMGSDYKRSQSLQHILQALDAVIDNEVYGNGREEPMNNFRGETPYLGATKSLSNSKRYKLLKSLA